jgi:hypothetical protein
VIALQVASVIYNAVMVASLKLSKVVAEPTVVFSFGQVPALPHNKSRSPTTQLSKFLGRHVQYKGPSPFQSDDRRAFPMQARAHPLLT